MILDCKYASDGICTYDNYLDNCPISYFRKKHPLMDTSDFTYCKCYAPTDFNVKQKTKLLEAANAFECHSIYSECKDCPYHSIKGGTCCIEFKKELINYLKEN